MREPSLHLSGGARKGILFGSVPGGKDWYSLPLYTCKLPRQGMKWSIPYSNTHNT